MELSKAMRMMLLKIEAQLGEASLRPGEITMYLAGGVAVSYYCQSRFTTDVDAFFSHRLLLNYSDLFVELTETSGEKSYLYLDSNYNQTLGPLHEDYEENAVPWLDVCDPSNAIALKVLSPLDLAVTKLGRFSDVDQDDILELASHGHFTADALKTHALEALSYYVGRVQSVVSCLDFICKKIEIQNNSMDTPRV